MPQIPFDSSRSARRRVHSGAVRPGADLEAGPIRSRLQFLDRRPRHEYAAAEGSALLHRGELDNPAKIVGKKEASQNCKVLSSKMAGSTVTFSTECANPNGTHITSSGEVTFTSNESYHAAVSMKQSEGAATNPILNGSTVTIDAKRIGDCAK